MKWIIRVAIFIMMYAVSAFVILGTIAMSDIFADSEQWVHNLVGYIGFPICAIPAFFLTMFIVKGEEGL